VAGLGDFELLAFGDPVPEDGSVADVAGLGEVLDDAGG
jgi:hypothetical protein